MVTNRFAKYLITITFLTLILYGIFVFRHLFQKPIIVLDQENFIETNEATFLISGYVYNTNSLSINTKPLLFEESGYFEQLRTLEDGVSTIILIGEDKFGRTTETSITINKIPQEQEFSIPEINEVLEDTGLEEIQEIFEDNQPS